MNLRAINISTHYEKNRGKIQIEFALILKENENIENINKLATTMGTTLKEYYRTMGMYH